MSGIEKIPLIIRENDISKTCKMLFIVGGIIILMIYLMHYQNTNIYYPKCNVEPMKNVIPDDKTQPVLGKYIQLVNLNHKRLPIYKIVVLDKDRIMHPLYTKSARYTELFKKGSMIQYELPKGVYISQIIIELELDDARSKHIATTQVRIRDAEYDTVWTSTKPLHVEKYVDVYVASPYLIYPVPQQLLDPDLSTCGKEVTLGYHLMNNTW